MAISINNKECLIRGQRLKYDYYSMQPLEKAKRLFQGFEYLGSSHIFFRNGKLIQFPDEIHFFRIPQPKQVDASKANNNYLICPDAKSKNI